MKIGLALGGGAARGWAHIGIINALKEVGIEPDIVCGTSIGALVGAAYTADNLNHLSNWVVSLTKLQTAQFFEFNATLNGFVNKDKLHKFLNDIVANESLHIEALDKQFAAVATEIETGREVWLQQGPILEAVWASIALPGLFPPIRYGEQWLLDGGLVNPVPVSACRALGADIVIAVNLNGDILRNHLQPPPSKIKNKPDSGVFNKFTELVSEYTTPLFTNDKKQKPPSLFDAIAASVNIIQDRITRSRMAGDPPDILLSPKLGHLGLLEFYRGKEAISEGQSTVLRMMTEIKHIIR